LGEDWVARTTQPLDTVSTYAHVFHPSLSRSHAKKNLGQEIGCLKIGLTVTQHGGKGKDVFMSTEPIKAVLALVDS